MSEKAYEKHAWILIFPVGIVGLILGILLLLGLPADPQAVKNLTGMTFDEIIASQPRIASLLTRLVARAFGVAQLSFFLSVLVITAVPYRKGEKWAWYTLWIVPASVLSFTAINLSVGGGIWPIFIVLVIIALLGLLLPYRKFFPRKQS